MSESGWTTGAAEPPIPGSGQGVRPLNDPYNTTVGTAAGSAGAAYGNVNVSMYGNDGGMAADQDQTPEQEGDSPRRSSARLAFSAGVARLWLGREARIGIAALLSFLILVSVLVVNKWKSPARSGKLPPVAKIGGNPDPESSGSPATPESAPPATAQAKTAPAPVGETRDHGDHPGPGHVASGTDAPPPPLPASTAAATLPPSSSPAPTPEVPHPVAEPAAPTVTSNQGPELPPSPAAVPEPAPGGPGPVTLPTADLPPATGTLPPEMPSNPEPAPASVAHMPPPHTTPETAGSIPEARETPGSHLTPSGDPASLGAPPSSPSSPALASTPTPETVPGTGTGAMPMPAPTDPTGPAAVEAPVALTPMSDTMPPLGKPEGGSPAPEKPKANSEKGTKPPGNAHRQPASIASEAPADPGRGNGFSTMAGASAAGLAAGSGSLDPVLSSVPTANPFADPAAAAGQGGWVALPNATARPQRPGALGKGSGDEGGPGVARTAMAGPTATDLVESVPHVVARGENFFSIAQQYYGSGRFYPALWKANSDQVPAPEKLVVGQTIRIPPPEALDRSLILPPRSTPAAGSTASSRAGRSSRPVANSARPGAGAAGRSSDVALALPVADPFADRDTDTAAGAGAGAAPGRLTAASPVSDRPRLPRYKIRSQETLRSIARDMLGDSRRAGEILELNREVIDDPNHLTPGQTIELPEDARLARQTR